LSLYPYGTWHDLRIFLIVASVFVVVMNVYRSMDQIKRLLGTVVLVGSVVLAIFYIQRWAWVSSVYGMFPAGSNTSGPFSNHNHYCQFMNLSVAAALALIVGKVDQLWFSQESGEAATRGQGQRQWRRWWASSDGIKLAALSVFVLLALVSVALSLSRGGMIAALGGGAVVLTLVFLRKKKPQTPMVTAPLVIAVLGLAAFGLVAMLGFDSIFARFEGSIGGSSLGARRAVAADLARMFMDYPLAGIGQGTHELVYPGHQTMVTDRLVQHADTDYFQLLAETGVTGILIFISFFLMAALAVKRVIQQNKEGAWICCGLSFGIVAVLIHSLTDFGQRLPANACLTALSIGLIFSVSRRYGADRGVGEPEPQRISGWSWSRSLGACLLLVCVMAMGMAMADQGYKAWQAERHAVAAKRIHQAIDYSIQQSDGGQGLIGEYAQLIEHAQSAARLQPGHAHYAHQLNLYRWRILRWSAGATVKLSADQWGQLAGRIADDQMAVERIAPTYGRAYELEGRVRWALGQRRRATRAIEIAYTLGRQDQKICLTSGLMELKRGNDAAALSQLRRATVFHRASFDLAIRSIIHEHGKPDLAVSLAGRNIRYQLSLAKKLQSSSALASKGDQIVAQVVRTLELQASDSQKKLKPQSLALLAQFKAKGGHNKDAAAYYRLALQSDYTNVNWRLARARLLAKSGKVEEAQLELGICLRLKPRYAPAKRLMASLEPGRIQD
jgi:O-antigen ligase